MGKEKPKNLGNENSLDPEYPEKIKPLKTITHIKQASNETDPKADRIQLKRPYFLYEPQPIEIRLYPVSLVIIKNHKRLKQLDKPLLIKLYKTQ